MHEAGNNRPTRNATGKGRGQMKDRTTRAGPVLVEYWAPCRSWSLAVNYLDRPGSCQENNAYLGIGGHTGNQRDVQLVEERQKVKSVNVSKVVQHEAVGYLLSMCFLWGPPYTESARRFCTPFIPFRVAGAAASARHVTTTESRRARTVGLRQLQRVVLSIDRRALFTYLRHTVGLLP